MNKASPSHGLGEAFCWIISFIGLHRQDVVFAVEPWVSF